MRELWVCAIRFQKHDVLWQASSAQVKGYENQKG